LRYKTQIQAHPDAVKMGSSKTPDNQPCSWLCRLASIWIQTMGSADLERGQRGKFNTKHKSKLTLML
jgi:hypothetical protein